MNPPAATGAARALTTRVRAGIYITVTLVAAVCACLYTFRQESIFSCPATGYGPDSYLAYCFANWYGDYDHGSFWFDLEPGVRARAAAAEVLFLGNSRSQYGFSSNAAKQWFADSGASYYLMGFAYWENYNFEGPLLRRVQPRAKVYVVNLDMFFETTENGAADTVMHTPDAYSRYRRKRLWQLPHRLACSRFPGLCGTTQAYYRSTLTGGYTRVGGEIIPTAVSYDSSINSKIVAEYSKRGEEFFDALPVDRRCVLLTRVPSPITDTGTAQALADALGMTLIAPQIAGLTTFDGSHLDRPSAERWSLAFLEAAGPRIRECLRGA